MRSRLREVLLGLEPAASAVFGTGVARLLGRGWRGRGCAVLCYHGVHEPGAYDDPSVTVAPGHFSEQVAFLAEHCQVVELGQVLDAPGHGARPRVAITFDDGYRELLEHALPELARHGAPSTVFCCSDVVEGRRALWWDELAAAVDRAPAGAYQLPRGTPLQLSDDASRRAAFQQLRARCSAAPEPLAEADRIIALLPEASVGSLYLVQEDMAAAERLGAEIGSHGRSHARLSALEDHALAEELEGSRLSLERYASRAVQSIAYPYGDAPSAGRAVVQAARAAGYRLGFTGRTGLAAPGVDPLAVPRVPVHGHDGARAFRGKACGPHPGVYARAARVVGA